MSPLRLLLFIMALAFLIGFVEFGVVRIAFDRLGLLPESAYLLLLCTLGVLAGSDLIRLKDIGKLGYPIVSIGGAGTSTACS